MLAASNFSNGVQDTAKQLLDLVAKARKHLAQKRLGERIKNWIL